MNDLSFTLLKLVISVATALITIYLVPYLKSRVQMSQHEEVAKIVSTSVKAAEQTLEGGKVKKADVVTYVTGWLQEKGITISPEQLDKLIEAAVYSMNHAGDTEA